MAEDAGEARVRDSSDVELPELPGSKRVSFAAGPEEPCRRSTPSLGATRRRDDPVAAAHRAPAPRCGRSRTSSSTAATRRRRPPAGRKRRWCQHEAVTFDLRNYKRVPEWLVEYKALLILQRVILAYHAACYLVYGGLIAAYVARVPSARRAATADVAAAPLPWAAFHTLSASVWKSNIQSDFNVRVIERSAFNNVGFSLQRDGFMGFARHPVLLYLVMGLVLHGNVLYPPCVRWIIVGLSAAAPRTSNRKVYFRYLLLHGRRLTPCLFSSQQNWLLVAAQVAMFLVQVAVLLSICYRDDGFRGESWWTRYNIAAFRPSTRATRA
ncbi:high-affinity potassium ion transmembrane transporter [Aureococcus anophagefferens]|nr:high-affinity potassium ion transmembrane transporter [Aureococcus anophagefferens]